MKRTEYTLELLCICPYCGDSMGDTYEACCGEAGHGEWQYQNQDGDEYVKASSGKLVSTRSLDGTTRVANQFSGVHKTAKYGVGRGTRGHSIMGRQLVAQQSGNEFSNPKKESRENLKTLRAMPKPKLP